MQRFLETRDERARDEKKRLAGRIKAGKVP